MKPEIIIILGITSLLAYGMGLLIAKVRGIPNLIIIVTLILVYICNIDFSVLAYIYSENFDNNLSQQIKRSMNFPFDYYKYIYLSELFKLKLDVFLEKTFSLFMLIPMILLVSPSIEEYSTKYRYNRNSPNFIIKLFYPFFIFLRFLNVIFSTISKLLLLIAKPLVLKLKELLRAYKIKRSLKNNTNREMKILASKLRHVLNNSLSLADYNFLLINSFLQTQKEDSTGIVYLWDLKSNSRYSLYDLGVLDEFNDFFRRHQKDSENNQNSDIGDDECNNTCSEWWIILEVSKNATEDEVKAAFHKLARKYHPDLSKSDTDEKFIELKAAYDVAIETFRR